MSVLQLSSLSGLQYNAFELPLSSLYINALLANLNARQFLRRTNIEFHTYELESARSRSFAWRGLSTTSGPPKIPRASQVIYVLSCIQEPAELFPCRITIWLFTLIRTRWFSQTRSSALMLRQETQVSELRYGLTAGFKAGVNSL